MTEPPEDYNSIPPIETDHRIPRNITIPFWVSIASLAFGIFTHGTIIFLAILNVQIEDPRYHPKDGYAIGIILAMIIAAIGLSSGMICHMRTRKKSMLYLCIAQVAIQFWWIWASLIALLFLLIEWWVYR